MRKKKVLFHSNYCGAPTGFGGFIKELLNYLYKLDKYELFLYASGMTWEHPDYARWPWKIYGALPNNQNEINQLSQDPNQMRNASYGALYIDKVIREVKPDIYIGIEDFWGVNYAIDRYWWNKINCVISWTADSCPLLPDAVEKACKINHHYVWAEFAEKEFKRLAEVEKQILSKEETEFGKLKFNTQNELNSAVNNFNIIKEKRIKNIEGFERVKTLRGCVNTNVFKRLSDEKKIELRKKHNIKEDEFLVGILSRNQLRKIFYGLIDGFKLFRTQNPNIKAKLLFFTSYNEGWNIPRLMQDVGLDNNDVLCCYKCRATGEYFVMPFQGHEINNPKTGQEKSLITVNLADSLRVEQINEWYNLLDVYCHPITSGGQERSVQEAKLCEIITLINPYSCGEDCCASEAYSLPLDFSTNREIGTQFIKASVYPQSIANQIKKVYDMPLTQRKEWGQNARKWVLENFSIEVVGKKYESLIDSLPFTDFNFEQDKEEPKDPNAQVEDSPDDSIFIKNCYARILKNPEVEVSDPQGFAHWSAFLNQPKNKNELKNEMVNIFRNVAGQHNQKLPQNQVPFDSQLIKNGKKQFLIVCPESGGDCLYVSATLRSFRESYPENEWNLYLATKPEFNELFNGNPYLNKILPYEDFMNNEIGLLGQGTNKGLFDGCCLITAQSQKFLNYLGNHKINLQIMLS